MSLKEELQLAAYAGMTPEQMLAAINADTVATTEPQLVPLWKIKKLCIETGVWVALKQAAVQTASTELAQVASLVLEYVNDPRFENLDLELASTKQMLGGLVAGGVITSDQLATINAMGFKATSRAVQLLGRPADSLDVYSALEGA